MPPSRRQRPCGSRLGPHRLRNGHAETLAAPEDEQRLERAKRLLHADDGLSDLSDEQSEPDPATDALPAPTCTVRSPAALADVDGLERRCHSCGRTVGS